MSTIKIYFLGTGTSQGIPVIGSNHSVCLSNDSKDKRLGVSVWVHSEDFSSIFYFLKLSCMLSSCFDISFFVSVVSKIE